MPSQVVFPNSGCSFCYNLSFPFSQAKMIPILLFIFFHATFQLPQLQYQTSFSTYSYSAFPSDTCKQMQITNNHIFRLGSNNVVMMVNKSSLATKATLLNYTYSTLLGLQITPNIIRNFNVDQNQTYITLAQATQTAVLFLPNFTMKMQNLVAPFYKAIFNNLVFTGFLQAPLLNDLFFQASFPSLTALSLTSLLTFSVTAYPLPTVKNCQCSQSPNNSYLVYWDQYSNVHVYNYTNTSVPPKLIGTLPSNITATDLTQAISFSPDGEYFLLEADAALPVTIVSLSPSSPLSKRTFAFNGTINRALFLDSASAFVVLFNDTAYSIASVALLTVLDSAALAVDTEVIEVDQAAGKVYLCKDSSVEVYNTSYASDNCSSNCAVCSAATLCLACSPNYALINNTCELSVSNTTATNSSTTQNNTNTSSNATSNSSQSSNSSSQNNLPVPSSSNSSDSSASNQTTIFLLMPDGSILVLQITYTQATIINSTKQAISYTNLALEKFMLFLTSTPFLFLFLGNIQIFTISSLYVLLNVPMPIDVDQTLSSTALALSNNIFTMFGITLNVPQMGVERVQSSKHLSHGVSSLYLLSNYQYFILSFIVIALIVILETLLTKCKRTFMLFYALIKQNKQMVIFGIFLSGFIPFLVPYLSIYKQPNSINFYDKLNQIMQFLTIGLVLAFVGVFPAIIGFVKIQAIENKFKETTRSFHKPTNIKKAQGSFKRLKKEKDNMYLVLGNVILPMLVVMTQPIYFLIFGQILLIFGLINAAYSPDHRANKIILSIYPIIFHLCFAVFHFSDSPSAIIIAEITCLLTYFTGSLHELITILYQFLSFVYRLIKKKLTLNNKISPSIEPGLEPKTASSFKKGRFKQISAVLHKQFDEVSTFRLRRTLKGTGPKNSPSVTPLQPNNQDITQRKGVLKKVRPMQNTIKQIILVVKPSGRFNET